MTPNQEEIKARLRRSVANQKLLRERISSQPSLPALEGEIDVQARQDELQQEIDIDVTGDA
tara:strand:- start:630 stop:812 length:183 start_codon:yes stop_codon:yes gene_type:complete